MWYNLNGINEAELSSQVYTCPKSKNTFSPEFEAFETNPKPSPGGRSVSRSLFCQISWARTHANWLRPFYQLARVPVHPTGFQSYEPSGLCGKTLSDLLAAVLTIQSAVSDTRRQTAEFHPLWQWNSGVRGFERGLISRHATYPRGEPQIHSEPTSKVSIDILGSLTDLIINDYVCNCMAHRANRPLCVLACCRYCSGWWSVSMSKYLPTWPRPLWEYRSSSAAPPLGAVSHSLVLCLCVCVLGGGVERMGVRLRCNT